MTEQQATPPADVLAGRNAVLEALKNGRSINKLLIKEGDRQGSIREIIQLAKERGVVYQEVASRKLDELAAGIKHQGVAALVPPVEYATLEDILAEAAAREQEPFIVLLDELEDVHNLGAILRTADAAGVHGVLIPKRRSCPLSATVAKTSAGALEYVKVARIGNVSQTLAELKRRGLWIVGADMTGEQEYYNADLTGSLALVIGGEGKGLGQLTKKNCDFLVKIPMQGRLNSLNASVAASIMMFESLKQRLNK